MYCCQTVYAASSRSSTGKPCSNHVSNPPSSGRTRVIPTFFNFSATLALVASFIQVQ